MKWRCWTIRPNTMRSILEATVNANRKYIDYPKPDTLPRSAAESRTIAEYMDLVLRETQADMVSRGEAWLRQSKIRASLSQGQISALRTGVEPQPCFWPLYQAALNILDVAQFYRLMRNSSKIAALKRDENTPLLDLIEFEDSREGQVVKYKNSGKWGAGGSDVNGGWPGKDPDAVDDAGRAGDSARDDVDRIRGADGRTAGIDPDAALVQTQPVV